MRRTARGRRDTAAARGRRDTSAARAAARVLAVVLTLAACSAAPPATPPPVTRGPDVAVEKVAPPEPVVPLVWPLTGVPADEVPERPALSVKIENPRVVRPQTGLEDADVVWEQVVEGGVTRFVAVYHSRIPPRVGPIRSVRPVDPDITAPSGGLVAFSGGQPRFVRALVDAGLQIVSEEEGHAGFWRDPRRAVPHTVFGDPARFLEQADARHSEPPEPQLRTALRPELATAVVHGAAARALAITLSSYSQPGWTWDAAAGAWLRTETSVPATAASGARLAATNVVALRVDLVDSGTRDPTGAVVPDTRLVGDGTATVATGGKVLDVRWSKTSVRAPLRLATADGLPVLLAPGTTWVELVPNGTGGVAVS